MNIQTDQEQQEAREVVNEALAQLSNAEIKGCLMFAARPVHNESMSDLVERLVYALRYRLSQKGESE